MNKKLNRTNKIIEILKEKNGATVKELASILNNIDRLESFYEIENETIKHENEKIKIGIAAANLVTDNDIIIIDTGTTTEKLAENISSDISITALIYNTNILNALSNKKNINLIFSGGYFHPNTQMFESPEGIDLIRKTRATKVFVSAAGVHENLGVTCSNNYEVLTKNAILSSSVEKILLVESEKFGIVKSAYFADLNIYYYYY